jgi:hypothetical protein
MINSINSANICGFVHLGHEPMDIMATKVEVKLNPLRYHLSSEAKKE